LFATELSVRSRARTRDIHVHAWPRVAG
jgi:hypothetical protein